MLAPQFNATEYFGMYPEDPYCGRLRIEVDSLQQKNVPDMKYFIIMILLITGTSGCSSDWWMTPDQQGDRLMAAEKFAPAAKVYLDPFRKGVAFFRDGNFEQAAAAFGRMNTAEAHFNRANSLVMLGKYTDAVLAYDRALALKKDWKTAQENREIARIRAERMKLEGGNMTGGMLGADEITFSEGGKNRGGEDEAIASNNNPPLSDEQIRVLWLRRVQTKPADFLKSKFSYQFSRRNNP